MPAALEDKIFKALDGFSIELPSWGFANTGTRFGKFHSGRRRHDHGREIQPTPARCTVHRLLPDRGGARPLGFPEGQGRARPRCASWPRGTACGSAPSTPTSSRTRSTSTARWAIPTRRSARAALRHILDCVEIASASRTAATFRSGSPTAPTIRARRTSATGKQWFIEGLQEAHRQMQPGAADAGGVQAVRAGLLPHRHRRLGHGPVAGARTRDRRRACWWIPAIITRRRTSSRSWPGCWTKTCSAASISTTAATPTTI